MDQRLVSENIMQCNEQSTPNFSAAGHLVAFKTDNSIKVKTFNKQIRECHVKVEGTVTKYFLVATSNTHYLHIHNDKGTLQIFTIYQEANEIKSKHHFQIPQCKQAIPHLQSVAFLTTEPNSASIKMYEYKTNAIQTIAKCSPYSQLLQHGGEKIVTITQNNEKNPIIRLYDLNEPKQENIVDYVSSPFAVYQDRFIFQNCEAENQVQIYDTHLSKLVGKFSYLGTIQYTSLTDSNILLIVTNNENVDKYYFFFLNPKVTEEGIVKNRMVYEKGKGSHYGICNMNEEYAKNITSGKGSYVEWSNNAPYSTILLFVQPKNKTKVEIIRILYSKILQNQFQEDRHDTIIHSKYHSSQKRQSQQKIKKQDHAIEGEKTRVAASMSHKKGDSLKNIQEIQRKMIDHLVTIKIQGLMDRFTELQRRLTSLENQIGIISSKIQKSIQSINKEEIKRNVQVLFERVTPQFESYFTEVFRQVSGVLDQGVSYYTNKLAKETEVHRDALSQVINMTFDATEQIVELGRKESKHSEATEKNIEKLLEIRKKWEADTREMLTRIKLPSPNINNDQQISLSGGGSGGSMNQPSSRSPNRRHP